MKKILLILLFLSIGYNGFSQRKVKPAYFDRGIAIGDNSGTSADPTGYYAGQLYWNDTLKKFRKFDGTVWSDLIGSTATPSLQAVTDVGSTTTNSMTVGTGGEFRLFQLSNAANNGWLRLTAGGGAISVSGSEWRFAPTIQVNNIRMGNAASSQLLSYNSRPVFSTREINLYTGETRIGVLNIGELQDAVSSGRASAFSVRTTVKHTPEPDAVEFPSSQLLIGTALRQPFEASYNNTTFTALKIEPTYNRNAFTIDNIYGLHYEPVAEPAAANHYWLYSSVGKIKAGEYGSGTISGTPTYNISVDANGNFIETANPAVGTTDYITNVSLSGTDLIFTGIGGAFNNTVSLAAIAGGGATNLSTTVAPTTVTINSDTGTDAIIPLADGTNAGISENNFTDAEKTDVAKIDVNEAAIATKQDILISGTNLKTINGESLLGSTDIVIDAGITSTPRIVTSTAGVFTEAYNEAQPNAEITVTEDTEIEITSPNSGDNLIFTARNTTSTPRVLQFIGTSDTLRATLVNEVADFIMITDTVDSRWSRSYKQGFKNGYEEVDGTGASVLNFAKNKQIKLILEGNDTPVIIEPDTPENGFTLYVRQGIDGSDVITWPANFFNTPTLTTTADRTDVLKFDYDGINFITTSFIADLDIPLSEPTYSPITRVNVGGASVTATDGEINWQDGTGGSGTGWSVSGGVVSTSASGITWTRHASIPASIPDADYQSLYDAARYTSSTQTWSFPVTNGDYVVNIFTGEHQPSGTGTTMDVTIEGALVLDDGLLSTMFGYQTSGMLSYDVTVADGSITVALTRVSGVANLFIHAIQILEQD
ncbi:MAG: malectin domain-containing carbohydrate-binding protein [Flavobacteriales bacterium]